MTSKELAEAMLDGSLNYHPTDDACSIAKSHLALVELVEKIFDEYGNTLSANLYMQASALLSRDPARPNTKTTFTCPLCHREKCGIGHDCC